jgi:hypothetical protein
MKFSVVVVMLAMMFPGVVVAQADADLDSYTNEELRTKYITYTIFRNSGFAIIGLATASLVSGIIVRANSKPLPANGVEGTNFTDEDFDRHTTGDLLMLISAPVSVSGAVLTIIGAKKHREYKERMRLQGLRVSISRERSSLALEMDF